MSNAGKLLVKDREARIRAALEALKRFLIEFMFGAKKNKYLSVIVY